MDVPRREAMPPPSEPALGALQRQRVVGLALMAGLALGMALVASTGMQRRADVRPSWVVVSAQQAALQHPADADLRARALRFGHIYILHGPDGPWKDNIRASHRALEAEATKTE